MVVRSIRRGLIGLMLLLPTLAVSAQDSGLTLTPLGTYTTGVFDEGAAEITAYEPDNHTIYVINGSTNRVDILDAADPTTLTLTGELDLSPYGSGPTSVAVRDGLVAVAVLPEAADQMGKVAFFNRDGTAVSAVTVGAHPDMVTFTPDGQRVVVANEGEPNDDYSIDGEGSVSIIDLSSGAASLTDASVTTLGFTDFNEGGARHAELNPDTRVYGPNATVAQDFEPEFIAISPDGATAYVTLQENNTIAVVDLVSASITELRSLGFKDYSAPGHGIDASNDDGAINITNWPVWGMYQPDGIVVYEVNGQRYILTANEGDSREYGDYTEEADVADLTLDATAFPNTAELQDAAALGNLVVTLANGDTDGDGDYDALYSPGARSFAVWTADGTLVFDSGDQFEQIIAAVYPDDFNATDNENGSFDGRSDNSGPEPEGIVLGTIGERTYAFIGLEKIGGVMVFDVTDPTTPAFVTYSNNRDFSGDPEAGTAGDLSPEGIVFVPAAHSPNGENLLILANEVSGSTTIYQINTTD